jgi:L-aspartate oxidase
MSLPPPRFLPAVNLSWNRDTDIVIVGTGAAGLSAAMAASKIGRKVILICKGDLLSGSTPLAQGGLAAAMDLSDSLDAHVSDTLVAAAGLAVESSVRELVTAAPQAVRSLCGLGARFDNGPLGLEGGHSHRRIVHAGGDAIGAELHRVLRQAVLDSDVEILENTAAIDVLKDAAGDVVGIIAGRVGRVSTQPLDTGAITARAVVLATGGFGQAYASSTNPAEVTGDGLGLAARAGAELTNIEFVQFHPTVFYVPGRRGQSPLITEALRGAGGTITDVHGRSVMRGHHPLGDLAPRDVVSFTMLQRMNSNDGPSTHLWLDARGVGARRLEEEFPTTVEICRSLGVHPASEPIPIAPGAHYACGGIRADLDGNTSLHGLYAVGEVACTGVHGANRLASNSLTEAMISGARLGQHLADVLSSRRDTLSAPLLSSPGVGAGVDPATREALAAQMSRHAGVLRNCAGLGSILETLEMTPEAPFAPLDLATLEATNLHTVSLLVSSAASMREESRGCHRRSDFAQTSDDWAQPLCLQIVEGEVVAQAGAMADT